MRSMLINCPRCGFSQPQDRYCANCGVDMETYKPAAPSAWKKILASPILHAAVIALIVIASVVMIKQRQKEELRARVEFLKAGPVMVERQNSPNTQTQVSASSEAQDQLAGAASNEMANADQTLMSSDSPSTTVPTNSGSTTASATIAALDGSSRTATTSIKMTALYLEVDRSLLNTWIEEAKNTGQQRVFERVTMTPLLQAATKLRSSQGVKLLQSVERNLDPSNPTQEWFVGTHQGSDPEQQLGFFASVLLNEVRDGAIRGDIEVQRAFRNPQDPARIIERVSFGSPFDLTAGSAYMMTGLLPLRYATPLPDSANPDPFLQVFKSAGFRSQQTEFTLVIQFATSRP